MELKTINITTTVKKIKTSWTSEMANDLSTFHNLDIESELQKLIADERTKNRKKSIINILKK
jgi:hypothetical protein